MHLAAHPARLIRFRAGDTIDVVVAVGQDQPNIVLSISIPCVCARMNTLMHAGVCEHTSARASAHLSFYSCSRARVYIRARRHLSGLICTCLFVHISECTGHVRACSHASCACACVYGSACVRARVRAACVCACVRVSEHGEHCAN